jgi:photosystem II stability/assembly factor-like uncharacterized protein
MQLVTANHGWALTDQRLAWTSDTGDTWSEITPPDAPVADIRGVFFLDPSHGWVVSEASSSPEVTVLSVFRTIDGGQGWVSSSINASNTASGGAAFLDFQNPLTGYLVVSLQSSTNFSVGEMYATVDGGLTWTKVSIPIGDPISLASPLVAWTAGGPAGDELYVTRDAGISWDAVSLDPPPDFQSSEPVYGVPTFFSNEEGGLPATFPGDAPGVGIYITQDGGQSWGLALSVPISDLLVELGQEVETEIITLQDWIVVIPNGARVYVTHDAGQTLQEIAPNGLPTGVAEVDFATGAIGWALSQSGECDESKTNCVMVSRLLRTNDSGQTWTQLNA